MSQNEDNKRLWTSIENLEKPFLASKKEFADEVTPSNFSLSRRDFLKTMGFSVLAFSSASCSRMRPLKLLGHLNKNENAVPGIDNWFATTCNGCSAKCGVLVKTRDGRPIKVEGNPDDPSSLGGVCAVGQATVLSLYDSFRFKDPQIKGEKKTWDELDAAVAAELETAKNSGKKIVLLSGRQFSPMTQKAIADFKKKYPKAEQVVHEAVSMSDMLDAAQDTYGQRILPDFKLDGLNLLLSFGADFLGTWLNPVAFSKEYTKARRPQNAKFMRHVQVESTMTLTGSNADSRIPATPRDVESLFVAFAKATLQGLGKTDIAAKIAEPTLSENLKAKAQALAAEVVAAKGSALVMSDLKNRELQRLANLINKNLGAENQFVFFRSNSFAVLENDKAFDAFVAEMNEGKVAAVLVMGGANPAYSARSQKAFVEAFAKVPTRISLSRLPDETAKLCDFVAPDMHGYEAWNDEERVVGIRTFVQPLVQPLFRTRQFQESLLKWSGVTTPIMDYLKESYKTFYTSYRGTKEVNFVDFWNKSLEAGVRTVSASTGVAMKDWKAEWISAAPWSHMEAKEGEFQVAVYEKVAIRDGAMAGNPWLQEMPDPISKVSWDNYVMMSYADAKRLKIEDTDIVKVETGAWTAELPVLIQAGQSVGAISVALGYGRPVISKTGSWKDRDPVGVNVFPLLGLNVKITKTGEKAKLARSQVHNWTEGRDLVRELEAGGDTALAYAANQAKGGKKEGHISLWKGHAPEQHSWAMAIDLSKCTGCSACVVSCQAENNIPVVGKDEIWRQRDLYWMRIDRYYMGDAEAPDVVHQPMLCHHCDNAPCETVCPVLATVHSADGLNQQAYNRCVGTRYCANNCPYKVRRFNWFQYDDKDELARMVLNPDVTVRSRGVMEKCSMCVQRINAGKLVAKKEGRELLDGEIKTACQQSCPTDAIVFGDRLIEGGAVAQMEEHAKNYSLLPELNLGTRLSYLPKVRKRKV